MPLFSLYVRPTQLRIQVIAFAGILVSPPVLMLPYREPIHLQHFTGTSNSRSSYHHMGKPAQDSAI